MRVGDIVVIDDNKDWAVREHGKLWKVEWEESEVVGPDKRVVGAVSVADGFETLFYRAVIKPLKA